MRADTELSRLLQKSVVAFGPSPDVPHLSLLWGSWLVGGVCGSNCKNTGAVTRDDSGEPLKLSSAVGQYEQERSTAVDGLYNPL
jgi:hypothetical protein